MCAKRFPSYRADVVCLSGAQGARCACAHLCARARAGFSAAEFQRRYLARGHPVLITDAGQGWPAMGWDYQAFSKAARQIPWGDLSAWNMALDPVSSGCPPPPPLSFDLACRDVLSDRVPTDAPADVPRAPACLPAWLAACLAVRWTPTRHTR
jgi:hypothetical protein